MHTGQDSGKIFCTIYIITCKGIHKTIASIHLCTKKFMLYMFLMHMRAPTFLEIHE